MDLETCQRLALVRNRALRIASEEMRRAGAAVREAAAGYLPTIQARGQFTASEALTQLEFPDPFTARTYRIEADLTPDYTLQLDAVQPLYTFGRLSNRASQSRAALDAARHGRDQTENQVLYSVAEAYYRFLVARDLSAVADDAVVQAERHLAAVKARFETGQASAFDRMRAEVRVANLRSDTASARRARETGLLALKLAIGLALTDSIDVAGSLEYAPHTGTLEDALASARSRRPELLAAAARERLADATWRLSRSLDNPQIALQGSASLYSFDLGDDPFSEDEWDNSYQANVVLEWPLFDGLGTHARVTQARAALSQAGAAREDAEAFVEFEVRDSFLRLVESREVVLSQESNRREAAEALRLAERSYAEGLVSSLDVQDAELALNQARTNYARALADYRIAEAGLRRATGTLADGFDPPAPAR
jgi:outer membrane protein TolC